MTFRIFDDSARKEIADHIHGAPARVQNRYGSNHGTDLLTSQGEPPPYNPNPPGTYTPGGSYPPGGGPTGYPPATGPGGSVAPTQGQLLTCQKAVPPSNDGNCPGPFEMNGKQFHFVKEGDGASAFCCAQEITPGSGPTVQPPSSAPNTSPCPPGSEPHHYVSFPVSEINTPKAIVPYSGLTPAQYIERERKACADRGGSFMMKHTNRNGIGFRTAGCCKQAPASGPGTSPAIFPPPYNPGPTGPTETGSYDGDKENTTPSAPSRSQIVYRARPLEDIPAGDVGWCLVFNDIVLFDAGGNCKKAKGWPLTTAKSTGDTLPTDCSKAKTPMIFARNPGAAVIERGVPVIAVKDFTGTSGGIVRATIVVVPCP